MKNLFWKTIFHQRQKDPKKLQEIAEKAQFEDIYFDSIRIPAARVKAIILALIACADEAGTGSYDHNRIKVATQLSPDTLELSIAAMAKHKIISWNGIQYTVHGDKFQE